jgi:hypothetical protein
MSTKTRFTENVPQGDTKRAGKQVGAGKKSEETGLKQPTRPVDSS